MMKYNNDFILYITIALLEKNNRSNFIISNFIFLLLARAPKVI